jgi:hypothetical protein
MTPNEIQAVARIASLSQMCKGKLVFVKRDDGLYMTRMGGWTDNKRMAAPFDFDAEHLADQLLQVQVEFGKEWEVEVITDDYTKKLMSGDMGAVQQALGQAPVPALALRINASRDVTAVKDWAEASAIWAKMREEGGFGMSNMPNVTIIDLNTGMQVAYVSYNGRVWPGVQWSPDAKPLYYPGYDEAVERMVQGTLTRNDAKLILEVELAVEKPDPELIDAMNLIINPEGGEPIA